MYLTWIENVFLVRFHESILAWITCGYDAFAVIRDIEEIMYNITYGYYSIQFRIELAVG